MAKNAQALRRALGGATSQTNKKGRESVRNTATHFLSRASQLFTLL